MLNFFRKIRRKLLNGGNLRKPAPPAGRYLVYALGEILLVVVGILVALYINNWNENRKQKAYLAETYIRVLDDLNQDIDRISSILDGYEQRKFVYERVIKDSITIDLFNSGLSKIGAYTGAIFETSMTGVNLLRDINTRDSLPGLIISTYDDMTKTLEIVQGHMATEAYNTVRFYRDNYDWYVEWTTKNINADNSSPELQSYFLNNRDYRNRVAFFYNLHYNNHVPILEFYKNRLQKISQLIEEQLRE